MSNVNEIWAPLRVDSNVTSDSNVTVTVPKDRIWQVAAVRIEYTSNATAGNRQIYIDFKGPTLTISSPRASVTQAASLVYHYNFSLVGPQELSVDSTTIPNIMQAIPGPIWMVADDTINIKDGNAVDVAGSGENMNITISGIETLLNTHLGGVLSSDEQTITS